MNLFENALNQHIQIFSNLKEQAEKVRQVGDCFVAVLDRGNKILVCGNGGSAADAQHFAAELMGRFEKERRAFGAVALTTDTSIITAVGNDYSFEDIFARQVEGLAQKGDVLLGISTSGNSENVLRAVRKAKNMGLETVGLLGKDGGLLLEEVYLSLVVPHTVTARIQEAHIFILHTWADMVDDGGNE